MLREDFKKYLDTLSADALKNELTELYDSFDIVRSHYINRIGQQSKSFSDEQIHEIAQMIDVGHVCFANPDTSETEIMFDNEMLDHYGISWEDEEENEDEEGDLQDSGTPTWQDEMYADVKAQMARINSWERFIRVEKPDSSETFGFMERFVEEIIPEGGLKERFWNALNRKHPFSNFNQIVHSCEYREDWFAFKRNEMEKYVRRELGIEGIPVYNGIYNDDGTKIDIHDIPMPDLCLTCESFLDDGWEENILCNLTRADKRAEGEEFKCGAWRKKKGLG